MSSEYEEINQLRIIMINELAEIFINNKDFDKVELYIDIDKTCMTPEKIIARVFNNNYVLRNKIMMNTKKISFRYNDNLIPTRYNLDKFINICKNTFKYVAYVTSRPSDEIHQIKKELSAHNLPTDIDIINQDEIKENISNNISNTIYYIDSDDNAYRNIISTKCKSNSILFQLSIF